MKPQERVIRVEDLIEETYKALQKFEYSKGSLKKYKY